MTYSLPLIRQRSNSQSISGLSQPGQDFDLSPDAVGGDDLTGFNIWKFHLDSPLLLNEQRHFSDCRDTKNA